MKIFGKMAAIVAASLSLASCGAGATSALLNSAQANPNTTAALQQTGAAMVGSLLSNILGATTTQQSLVGTWTYEGPKVVFESENILSQLGGQVVSNNLEQKFGAQLTKLGFSASKFHLTLNGDNTCQLTFGSKTYPGTYTYDADTHKLVMTGAFGMGQLSCTASIQLGKLLLLFEADKLLSVATAVSAKGGNTLSSLISNYKGLKLGWSMTK